MANIDPAPSWAPIRQLETTDRNLAGPGGVLNTQPTSIAARLNLLRNNATALNNTVAGVSSRQDAADSAIASLQSQVLDSPGTLSDLDHGAPITVTGDQFPDVLSIDNSRGPVLALNESIADLAQRDEWLKAQIEALPVTLAADDGASKIGFTRNSPDAVLVAASDIFKNYLSVIQAGADPTGALDSTAAFQRAINWVIALGESGKTYAVPAIVIPGGEYKLTDTLQTKPWVHMVSDGSVFLNFKNMAASKHGIVCNNNTTAPTDDARFAGNHSPFLNGSRGTITLLGPGKSVSTGSGVRIGNFASGLKPFRDARMSNVVITGFNIGQEWGYFDTYLCRTENCRFEQNNYAVTAVNAATTNSGERMEWSGCTFSGSIAAFNHNQPGFNATFVDCSFDFNDDCVRFGSTSAFSTIKLTDCYFEAFSDYLVNGSALQTAANTNQVAVMVSNLDVLARGRDSGLGVNSPSRTLFTGSFSLNISTAKPRWETRPYLEDGMMISSTTTVVGCTGQHVAPYYLPYHQGQIVNDDWNFQRDIDGTLGTALTMWERGFTAAVTADIFTTGGKKVLRLVGTSGAGTSNTYYRSKSKVPCRQGDVFYPNICLNANSATGTVLVLAQV